MAEIDLKDKFLKLIAIFVGATLALVIAEGLLRMSRPVESGTRDLMQEPVGTLGDLEILAKKAGVSAKTFNIYYFGGSSMVGEPYDPVINIPKLVDFMVGHSFNGLELRSVNLANCGVDLAYNLARLRVVLENRSVFHPSLLVFYSGHNEFIKFHPGIGFTIRKTSGPAMAWAIKHLRLVDLLARVLRRYSLEIDERRFFDEPIFAEENYGRVIKSYAQELRDLRDLADKEAIPTIVSTLASNYADWDPNRSVFTGSETEKSKFLALVTSARAEETAGNLQIATSQYERALGIWDGFAEAHYRLGRLFRKKGDARRAWQEFSRAVDLDKMPLRALSTQNALIRNMRETKFFHTVDALEYLRAHSTDGLIGLNLMADGVHPNLRGYLLISELIAQDVLRFSGSQRSVLRIADETQAMKIFNFTSDNLIELYIGRGQFLSRVSTWRFDPAFRLALAEKYLRDAEKMKPDNAKVYFWLAIIEFLKKNTENGNSYLAKARKLDSKNVSIRLQGDWVRQVLERAYFYAP